jgi:hypothetical protein
MLYFLQNFYDVVVDEEVLNYIVYRIGYIDDKIFLIVLNIDEIFALLHDENVDQQNNKIKNLSIELKKNYLVNFNKINLQHYLIVIKQQ